MKRCDPDFSGDGFSVTGEIFSGEVLIDQVDKCRVAG